LVEQLPSAVNNRNLFSNHYLEMHLDSLPEWRLSDHVDAFRSLKERYEAEAAFLPLLAESQLEQRLFQPVFKLLGFAFEVQAHIEDGGDYPDYALFSDKKTLDEAHKSRGTRAFYDKALVIGEVKRWNTPLDQFGRDRHNKRRNPSFQIWLYLHETKPKWGILSDGQRWRLYHKDRPLDVYYEVDLAKILQEENLEAFRFFFYFFRKAAFVPRADGTVFLEQVLQGSIDYALKVGENLKENVYRALRILAQGFFDRAENGLNPHNREHLAIVQQNVMRLLYRLLFVLYAEGKGLLSLGQELYRETYSVHKLKHEIAERKDRGEKILSLGTNYWNRLRTLFQLIDRGSEAFGISGDVFYIPPYNGGLFDPIRNPFLEEKVLGDSAVADAIDLLARAASKGGPLVFVDYSTLKISHLGSIYEGLLEYRIRVADQKMVAIGKRLVWTPFAKYAEGRKKAKAFEEFPLDNRVEAGEIYVGTFRGERKLTGSYYTPEYIVDYIVKHTIGPTLERRWNDALKAKTSLRDATLSIRVVDPAMGSGHFLLGAVEFLGTKLLEAVQKDLETGHITEEQAARYTPEEAKREVLSHCIYGVDLNELAVELAKVSLWLFTISKQKPLSFLDHRLKHGNSLIGAWLRDLAYYPPELLKGPAMRSGADRNQTRLETTPFLQHLRDIVSRLNAIAENTREDIEVKKRLYDEMLQSEEYRRIKDLADIRTALFFGAAPEKAEQSRRQYGNLTWAIIRGDEPQWRDEIASGWRRKALEIAATKAFFHWELEFPDVFRDGDSGFDAMIGNPPYVNALLLARSGDPLEREFLRLQFSSARGAFDLYVPFLELGLRLTKPGSRWSLITPNKFLSAPYAKAFRGLILKTATLERILDASRAGVFEDPAVYPVVTVFRHAKSDPREAVVVEEFQGANGPVEKASFPHSLLAAFPEHLWSFLLSRGVRLILRLAESCVSLGEIAKVQASTTAAEADEFSSFLFNCEDRPDHSRHFAVINTGLIDRYHSMWGDIPLVHAGRTFGKACIMRDEPSLSEMRRRLFERPKLIVAKVANVPEVVWDHAGRFASVNVNFIFDSIYDLRFLLAILNSQLMSFVYREYFGALTMQGGYAQFQAPQLRVLPVPKLSHNSFKAGSRDHLNGARERLAQVERGADPEILSGLSRYFQSLLAEAKSPSACAYNLLLLLADRLIDLYGQRRHTVREFLDWICSPLGLSVDLATVRNRTRVEKFSEHPRLGSPEAAQELEAVLSGHGFSRLSPKQLAALREEYRRVAQELLSLQMTIREFETLVDGLVYRLYGLSADEIALVENARIDEVESKYGWALQE